MGQLSKRASIKPVVLLVEDDSAVRNSLKFSLEIEGFSVRAYKNGTELLGETPYPGARCLIIDYRLPGLNGLELLAELRRREVVVPAILVTTNPSPSLRARATAAGVMVIEKPLLNEALVQGIHTALAL